MNGITLEDCKSNCTANERCLGIFYRYYITKTSRHNYCYGLTYLGYGVHTYTNSYSYTKQVHHIIPEEEHTIEGYVVEQNQNHQGVTVYIDLNHDGHLNSNEPVTHTDEMGNFYFHNISDVFKSIQEFMVMELNI